MGRHGFLLAHFWDGSDVNQEIIQAAKPAAIAASGAATTWWTHENMSSWVSIGVGILTAIYIVVQMLHLLRTWYIREKLYAKRHNPSDFMKLD